MSSAPATQQRNRTRERSAILYLYEDGVRRLSNRDPVDLVHEASSDALWLGVDVEEEFTEQLPALHIPGFDDEYPDCGEKVPRKFCNRCGGPVWTSRRCRRARCSECWPSWAKKQAVEICSKVNGRQRYENRGPGPWIKMHHVVVSPPPEFRLRSDMPLDKAKEAVKLILGEGGAFEGAIIYHPYRIKEKYRDEVLGHEEQGDGDMLWKDVLERVEEEGVDAIEEYLVHEPHFHAFVTSPYFRMHDGFYESSGWVVKRVDDDSGASIRELPDLCRAVAYCLSHAGLRETDRGLDATYWYFGETSTFTPTEGVKFDVDAAMRAVAPQVLGVEFPPIRCNEGAEGVLNVKTSTGSGGEPPAEVAVDSQERYEDEECNGLLVSTMKAPEYLVDEGWRDGAPRWRELEEAWVECVLSKYPALEEELDQDGKDPPGE